ncbi:MAG: Transketolase [Chloroflexi bacterium]|nr:Transketolase [Chloroflexota bacterium]
MPIDQDLQTRAINTLRFLSVDAINRAQSGHPGLPLGDAALAYTLWTRHLRHNPKNPAWPNRDRFILSGGHGSALLYSLLHLTGYDLSLEEVKNFRQWGSLTPGHPEYGLTPGVETTTGPLGQGFSNGVGMAIAQAHLAAQFNRPGHIIFDNYIYAIVTDGDLMEGITAEAASLAGHLELGKLIYLYDDNRISIDGNTDLTFTEDRAARFEAYGWQTLFVEDGNDVEAIDAAITAAKEDARPTLIVCRTHIGYGLPAQDTAKAHGSPPSDDELNTAKENLNWPLEPRFLIPEDVGEHFAQAVDSGQQAEESWRERFAAYEAEHPALARDLTRRWAGELPPGWREALPSFPADPQGMATRKASGTVINALAPHIPELLGGSADLAPSTKTWIEGSPAFQSGQHQGRNFHFGVREHGMGAIVNGVAVYGGLIPFGATFLVFSDYMRGALRLSALSHMPSIWVFTHDSVGVGEDGPTHQPVEHVAALRLIPKLTVLRPADANETAQAWKIALQNRGSPTALVLTRQSVPTLDRETYAPAEGVERGAYVLGDLGDQEPELVLMASGSEVSLIVRAGELLAAEGVNVRLVSMPSWELFQAQDKEYRDLVLPPAVKKRLAVEAGVSYGWERWVGESGKVIAVDRYGASAPGGRIYQEYGLSVENIILEAEKLGK